MRALPLVLAASFCGTAASAQWIPEWERLHVTAESTHVEGETIAAVGTTGHWYVGGRGHSFVNQDYFPHWEAGGHLLMRLDDRGQVVWSRAWSALPAPPMNNAERMEIATDLTGDARIVYATSLGGVVLERRSAADGSIVWSTPGPVGAGRVIQGSLAAFADGRQIVALVRGNDFEYVACSADGALLQDTIFTTNLAQGPGFVAATDPATGRLAVAATAWSVQGVIAVHAADGAIAWSNNAVDMAVFALAFGPGGVLAAVGTDPQLRLRFRLYDAAGATIGEHAEPGVGPLVQGWHGITFDAWGNAVVVGRIGDDASIARFSASGALEWHRSWVGLNDSAGAFRRVLASPSGDFVALGTTSVNSTYPQQSRLAVTTWRRDGTLAGEHVDPPTAGQNETPATMVQTRLGSIVIAGKREHAYSFQFQAYLPDGVHVLSLRPQASAYCFGDSASTSLCPCGNASAPGALEGCANSTGSGARLVESGLASLLNDTLALTVSGLPPNSTCLVFQARSAGAVPFGDGVRCALGGPMIRLYTAPVVAGVATVPPPAGPSVSARAAAAGDALLAGSVRYMQAHYRDVGAFCTPAAFNASSGLILTWAP